MKKTHLTFLSFVVLMVGLGASDSLRGIFSSIFSQHFSLSATQLGLIVTVSYMGNLVFLLLGGNLLEMFPRKKTLIALTLIWMTALLAFAATDSYPILLCGMFFVMGASTLLNTTLNLITPLLFAGSPAFFVNLLFFTQGIGTSGSQSILGSLASGFSSWQKTNGGLLLLGSIGLALLCLCPVPEPDKSVQSRFSLLQILKTPCTLPYIFAFGFYFIAEHGVLNWLVVYATSGLQVKQSTAANALAIFFGCIMIGRLVLSPLVDRLGVLKSLRGFALFASILYGIGVLGGAHTLFVWALSGLFLSILYPTLVMSIRGYFPAEQVSSAAGTIISAASLFDILFNLVFGKMIDLWGYQNSIWVLPVSLCCCAVLLFFAFREPSLKSN